MPGPAPLFNNNTPSSSLASSGITTHSVNGIMNGLSSQPTASSSAGSNSNILVGLSAPAGPSNALFPALYLYPLNDTWLPKHIALTGGPSQHVKIGRQTSSKTAPGEKNGFFDSKVLSRQHAEVWEDGGKIFIKDVKSSNGTFINGDRLSSEGHESEPFEMKSDDIVEFGIDIVGEDNKTIIHHKVAARVVCVFNEQDAQVAARAEQHQQQHQMQQHQAYLQQQQQQQQHGGPGHLHGGPPHPGMNGIGLGGPSSVGVNGTNNPNNNFPFTTPGAAAAAAAQQQQQQQQRRQQLAQQGLGSLGSSMGVGGLRPPGKTGLSFDVILSRLQGEVQKSRETGAELSGLTGAMGEIGDVLGGVLPTNLPPFPAHLPPVRPPQEPQPQPQPVPAAAPPAASAAGATQSAVTAALSSTSGSTENSSASSSSSSSTTASSTSSPAEGGEAPASLSATAVEALQAQLRETQAALASHLDRVRKLEDVLVQHDEMRREVEVLKERIGMVTNTSQKESRGLDGDEVLLRRLEDDHHLQHEEGEQVLSDYEEGAGSEEEEDEEQSDDDDDARSIATVVVSHELERVDEEDESELGAEGDSDALPDEAGALPEEDMIEQRHIQEQQRRREAEHDEVEVAKTVGEAEELERMPEDEEDEERERERRKEEDLEVGRPRTPEPTAFVQRRTSVSSPSPLSTSPTSLSPPLVSADRESRAEDMYEQVVRLSKQVSTVMELTSSLEAQHSTAQTTIKGLEDKVATLEGMLKAAEEALAAKAVPSPATSATAKSTDEVVQQTEKEEEEKPAESKDSLMDMISHFKKSVDGQWGSVRNDWASMRADWVSVRSEWAQEREKLTKAWAERERVWDARQGEWDAWRGEWESRRGEWDGRKEEVDKGLVRVEEGLDKLQHVSASVVAAGNSTAGAAGGFGGLAGMVSGLGHHLANGGLVTPPSPRSQSSDSVGRRGYNGKRRSLSGGRGRSTRSRSQSPSVDRGEYDDASSVEDHEEKGLLDSTVLPSGSGAGLSPIPPLLAHGVASLKEKEKEDSGARSLATPEPSVYANSSLESEGSSPTQKSKLAESTYTDDTIMSDFSSLADSTASMVPSENGKGHTSTTATVNANNAINLQAAMGIVVLSVAAAAVFWKVKPEA